MFAISVILFIEIVVCCFVPVYVFLGVSSNQGRFMTTLKGRGLLEDGDYIVVGVEFETNNVEQSYKYYFGE